MSRATLALRVSLLALLAVGAWSALGSFDVVPPPPGWLMVSLFLVAGALWMVPSVRRHVVTSTDPLRPAEVTRGKGGGFEWRPGNEAPPDTRLFWTKNVHREAPVSRATALVTLQVNDASAAVVRKAVKAGAAAATRAMPGRAKVRVRAEERDLPGPDSRLRARVEVEGPGANGEWAKAAADAFAEAFVKSVEARGLAAVRL